MATSLAFLFFGTLAVVGAFSMVKIHIAQGVEADEAERKRKARIEACRAKCYQRVDGD